MLCCVALRFVALQIVTRVKSKMKIYYITWKTRVEMFIVFKLSCVFVSKFEFERGGTLRVK